LRFIFAPLIFPLYTAWHPGPAPSPQDPLFLANLPAHFASSSCTSDLASADRCAILQKNIFTYLLTIFQSMLAEAVQWLSLYCMQMTQEQRRHTASNFNLSREANILRALTAMKRMWSVTIISTFLIIIIIIIIRTARSNGHSDNFLD